jgi:anti-sigma B factor antagonist
LSTVPLTGDTDVRMCVTITCCGTAQVVTVSGEIDLATAPQLTRDVARVINRADESVVLDLGPVAFLDSSALHVIVDLAAHAREKDIRLTILPAHNDVHLPFVITGLDQVLPFSAAISR